MLLQFSSAVLGSGCPSVPSQAQGLFMELGNIGSSLLILAACLTFLGTWGRAVPSVSLVLGRWCFVVLFSVFFLWVRDKESSFICVGRMLNAEVSNC